MVQPPRTWRDLRQSAHQGLWESLEEKHMSIVRIHKTTPLTLG